MTHLTNQPPVSAIRCQALHWVPAPWPVQAPTDVRASVLAVQSALQLDSPLRSLSSRRRVDSTSAIASRRKPLRTTGKRSSSVNLRLSDKQLLLPVTALA